MYEALEEIETLIEIHLEGYAVDYDVYSPQDAYQDGIITGLLTAKHVLVARIQDEIFAELNPSLVEGRLF